MLNCKKATELMSRQQDMKAGESLNLAKRIELKMHLFMCNGCHNYNKQLKFIRKAMNQYTK